MSAAGAIRKAIAAALRSKLGRAAATHGKRWVIGAAAGKAVGSSAGGAAGYLSADADASEAEKLQRAGIGAALGFNFGGVTGGSIAVGPAAIRALRRAAARRLHRTRARRGQDRTNEVRR